MEIVTQVEIAAPPARVWEVLTRFEDYPSWNAFLPEVTGELREGARLRVRIVMPGSRTMKVRPRLLRVVPGRELRWKGRLLVPGLFSGEHAFLLEPAAGGTHFVQRERFRGLLLPLLRGMLERGARPGFEQMNRALKARAEGA
jgi:hypothetical protein